MTDLTEPSPVRVESETEAALSAEVYSAIQRYSRHDARGKQSQEYRVGISDLGFCSERTRRMLGNLDPEERDLLAAFTGTALGAHIEAACKQAWPDAITQAEVVVPLVGDQATYNVGGHPDLIRPDGLLIDFKTTRGLGIVRRVGPSQQQQFQRHCYAKAAWLAGLFGDTPLEDVTVANVWMDRSCDEKVLYTHAEPYSEQVVEQATMWLDEVVWAYVNKQTARKEPARELCAAACGFYATCRALDTDVEGLLTDDSVLAAVDMHREAVALERQAKSLKAQAKSHLDGVQGSTGEYTVKWVWVNGGHVEYVKQGYQRLDIRATK